MAVQSSELPIANNGFLSNPGTQRRRLFLIFGQAGDNAADF